MGATLRVPGVGLTPELRELAAASPGPRLSWETTPAPQALLPCPALPPLSPDRQLDANVHFLPRLPPHHALPVTWVEVLLVQPAAETPSCALKPPPSSAG